MFPEIFVDFLSSSNGTPLGKPRKRKTHPFVVVCEASNNQSYGTIFPIGNLSSSIKYKFVDIIKVIDIDAVISRSDSLGFSKIDNEAKMFVNTVSDFLQSNNIKPSNTFPVEEGGISVEISKDGIYYNIEITNNEASSFYKESPDEIPEGWDYSYSELIFRLSKEFNV